MLDVFSTLLLTRGLTAFKINAWMGVHTVEGREATAKLIAIVLTLQPDAPIW